MVQLQKRMSVPAKTTNARGWLFPRSDLKVAHNSSAHSAASVLMLQRAIGNRAVAGLVGRSTTTPRHASVATPGVIGDPKKESLADRTAERIVRKVNTPGPRGTSSVATQASTLDYVRLAMRDLVAPERLDSITVDASTASRRAADRIGALAFADGNKITFGTRSRHLSPDEKLRLTAHEVAHATLHPSTSDASRRLVHAKLAGTHAVALATGGEPKQGIRRFGPKRLQTNWKKIIDGLAEYERKEMDFFAKGSPNPQRLAQAKPELISLLKRIEADLEGWKTANRHDYHTNQLEGQLATQQRNYVPDDGYGYAPIEDTRPEAKVGRHQVVPLILVRVRNELKELHDGTWEESVPLSLHATGTSAEGSKYKLNNVTYQTGHQGTTSGFFKKEYALHEKREVHEDVLGLPVVNPNLGGRSMAMYKLDRLLSAGVTAKVEYAVHNGELGIVMEEASGKDARSLEWTIQPSETGKDGRVRANDPVLQQCLNKLQILDAIAGQIDRHSGNYYVQRDANSGSVTGVTGIDLDMAFGKDMHDPTAGTGVTSAAMNYRGVPKLFDEQMANKILMITDAQVRDAIDGLLSKEEVDATVSRFKHVKESIEQAKRDGTLVSQWDDQSFKKLMPTPDTLKFDISGYVVDASKSAIDDAANEARGVATALIPKLFSSAPPATLFAIQEVFGRTIFAEHIKALMLDMSVSAPLVPKLTTNVLLGLANDKKWWMGEMLTIQDVTDRIKAILPDALKKATASSRPLPSRPTQQASSKKAPPRPPRPLPLRPTQQVSPKKAPPRPSRPDKPKGTQGRPLPTPPVRRAKGSSDH
ncbi:DUF4157 domain-containing protein [Ferrimicrobium sp.]|uniref:eCIS core domain-containing protein n=2 Tax=Ferrimicrobium sp. TaxID=2926050 RepID=UPI0026396645|nr:DUF4157 domain-containing protein [Ferrimicrobium sp.]